MAAAPASQPDQTFADARGCAACRAPLAGDLAPHVCASCGSPQPVAPGEDCFAALGVERKFGQDLGALEKRFYALSRALHPDRFSALARGANGAGVLRDSMARMSFLNQAYSTLKGTDERRAYLLQLEGLSVAVDPRDGKNCRTSGAGAATGASLPLELAEAWFELQDALVEDQSQARPKLAEFEAELRSFTERQEQRIVALESQYDSRPERATLERIAGELRQRSYLKSLERDLRAKSAAFV